MFIRILTVLSCVLALLSGVACADEASIRVTGPYRTARLWTLDHPEPRAVTVERQKDALEIHLPPCSVYAAVEVEA